MPPVDFILFDLDNTLYPRGSGLFDHVDRLINRYLAEEVRIPAGEVDRLRRHYLETYGTTLSGLIRYHGVDPEHYLAYVHAVPIEELIPVDPELPRLLASLPGEKYIFSNASRDHCLRVLTHLGVADCFREIYDIVRLAWRPKPRLEVYQQVLAEIGRPPERGVMVDDLPANLEPARALGLRAVLVAGDGEAAGAGSGNSLPAGVAVIDTIHRLPQALTLPVPRSCGPASTGG